MVCVVCKAETQYGFTYCIPCMEKDKQDKEEAKRKAYAESFRKEEEFKKLLKNKEQEQEQEQEQENPNAITLSAAELLKLTEEMRKSRIKTEEEYKTLIDTWINKVCTTLNDDLIKCASNGRNKFNITSDLFINPGILPNGNRCYGEWQFRQYITNIIDPIKFFKDKVGKGIKVENGRYEPAYCGKEEYPKQPEDFRFEYRFSW